MFMRATRVPLDITARFKLINGAEAGRKGIAPGAAFIACTRDIDGSLQPGTELVREAAEEEGEPDITLCSDHEFLSDSPPPEPPELLTGSASRRPAATPTPTPAPPPPFTPAPEGEIPWEDAADVIMYIISIVGGLVVMLIALGMRRMRQNERALIAAKAAKAARDNPPGVVAKADLTAVEKVARTVTSDIQPFLDALTRCEVVVALAKPCTPAAVSAMRKALAGQASWPEDPPSAAAAGALLHAQLHAESLPAKGVWPRGVSDACEYAREAVVEVSIRLTRHAFDFSCKGGDVEGARALLRLLTCLRLGLHSWTDAACLAAMHARVAAEGMPVPNLEAACSARSWMGERGR
jgi:hypothetical protein